MEKIKPKEEVLAAINDQVQKDLKDWKLYPENKFVAQALGSRLMSAVEKGGHIILKIKADTAAEKLEIVDFENLGYLKGGEWTCELNGKGPSLKIFEDMGKQVLGITNIYTGDVAVTIASFLPEKFPH